YRALLDQNRDLIAWHRFDAREAIREKQEALIGELETKLASASEVASDEFMYQDRAEAERELEAARQLLGDIPVNVSRESVVQRAWNALPYERYRGADKE
ncbi:MAG: sulfate adenylyltransferase, partial [Leucobacter sp.]|nr:sulfate adenylyltransferase [Leucobacter sp.]